MLKVYLCGPLDSQAGDRDLVWRRRAADTLASLGVKPINPIRGFGTISDEEQTLTPNEIVTRDRRDALSSDVLLVNVTSATYPSIGTASEMAWAWERGIPIVAVWPHQRRVPVFLRHFAARVFGDPEVEGVDEAGGVIDACHYIADHWRLP
jgi:nucleoside 2-deoxyribosyltransferase